MTLAGLKQIDRTLGHLLIFLFRPLAILLGALLRRDHELTVKRHLVILKMLGGGSLIVALPALLAIHNKLPGVKMTLVCSKSVKVYADLMHIFDEIVLVETHSIPSGVLSGLRAILRSWRADCIIDLEVHSKLSTVFCLLTCARNRVGYFMETNRWRLGLGTHFLFLNVNSLIATGYNQLATMFGTEVDIGKTVDWFRSENAFEWNHQVYKFDKVLALAPFCSELGKEREFTAQEWSHLLQEKIGTVGVSLLILGDSSRVSVSEEFERVLAERLENCEVVNLVGKTSLKELGGILSGVDELVTIDSGVNHIARLIGPRVTSYWGPTDPGMRLLPIPGLQESVFYKKIFCSPCVHHIDSAPCCGNNICMKQHVGPVAIDKFEAQGWFIDKDTPLL